MPRDKEPRPNGIKLGENGAEPTYPTDVGKLKAAIMRSTTGRDVVFVEPTTPGEVTDFLNKVHRESSDGADFPIDFLQAVRELKRRKGK
ncbi:MAG TPA: hypothetical protein VF189_02110 [Patescibacteria group bacterium]